MTIGTRIFTWLRGAYVGGDEQGNRYYHERRAVDGRRRRRWVVYNGEAEASRVPADWHGWLHYTVDAPPPEGGSAKRSWQKAHKPNLSGTEQAYRPAGHSLSGGARAPATGDYQPWTPS
jgi:NADH:ubiquinone oxidoreductase subunit